MRSGNPIRAIMDGTEPGSTDPVIERIVDLLQAS